jgi:hypothetical protein
MPNQTTSIWLKPGLHDYAVALRKKGKFPKEIAEAANKKFGVSLSENSVDKHLRRSVEKPAGETVTRPAPTEKYLTEEVIRDREVKEAKASLEELQRKYKIAVAQANAVERLMMRLGEVVEALPPVKAPKPYKISKDTVKESAVLVGSCWHIGEKIDFEEMGGLNEYNFDIFTRRLQHVVDKTISFTQGNMSNHVFEDLHVFLTGDMVSGIIHEELIESNELHIVDQALMGALVTAQALQDLAGQFPKVIVTCVVGNHGRTQKEKTFKNKGTKSWDYVFYNTLAMLLKNQPNIEFIIPKSYWAVVDVQGHLFQVQHGDTVRGSLGIPFYGFKREVGKWAEIHAVQNRIVRYYVTSHFHTKAILQSGIGEMIMNASLKGGDEYAIGLGLYGDPIQLLFGVHERYGKTWELSLNAKYTNAADDMRYRFDLRQPIANQLALVA